MDPRFPATSARARVDRTNRFEREGLRRTVDAVILVQQHGHPHVLLLQVRPPRSRGAAGP